MGYQANAIARAKPAVFIAVAATMERSDVRYLLMTRQQVSELPRGSERNAALGAQIVFQRRLSQWAQSGRIQIRMFVEKPDPFSADELRRSMKVVGSMLMTYYEIAEPALWATLGAELAAAGIHAVRAPAMGLSTEEAYAFQKVAQGMRDKPIRRPPPMDIGEIKPFTWRQKGSQILGVMGKFMPLERVPDTGVAAGIYYDYAGNVSMRAFEAGGDQAIIWEGVLGQIPAKKLPKTFSGVDFPSISSLAEFGRQIEKEVLKVVEKATGQKLVPKYFGSSTGADALPIQLLLPFR